MKPKISLSATGWIEENPIGNRLRWRYPKSWVDIQGRPLGLPETIVIQRAPITVKYDSDTKIHSPARMYPPSWWDQKYNLRLENIENINMVMLPEPVQVIKFQYSGQNDNRLIFKDSATKTIVGEHVFHNNEKFTLEAHRIDQIWFDFWGELKDFETLNLYKERNLHWETLAEIKVRETLVSSADVVSSRFPNSILDNDQKIEIWGEILEFQNEFGERPKRVFDDDCGCFRTEPSKWDAYDFFATSRWEFAVLLGEGFYDGPRNCISPLDRIIGLTLDKIPPEVMAYRVYEKEGRTEPSNIVICYNRVEPPLVPPEAPIAGDSVIRFNNARSSKPGIQMEELEIQTNYNIIASQLENRGIGFEIEEKALYDSPEGIIEKKSLDQSKKRFGDPVIRNIEMQKIAPAESCYASTSARARTIDGWDRESIFSDYSIPRKSIVVHHPIPPPLDSASIIQSENSSNNIRIRRKSEEEGFPEWKPDRIVTECDGKINIYRRDPAITQRTETCHASSPIQVGINSYEFRSTVDNHIAHPDHFIEGYIISNSIKLKITRIETNGIQTHFFIESPSTPYVESSEIFPAGQIVLQENPMNLRLWVKIAEFSSTKLPHVLEVYDPIFPDGDETRTVSYCARISFFNGIENIIGPSSNIIQVVYIPTPPTIPPPFNVAILGVDFFNRTMIKITLTTPVSSGFYSVCWAAGEYKTDDENILENRRKFGEVATPGIFGKQSIFNDKFLFELFALPIPLENGKEIKVTIGVQKVDNVGGQSDFEIIPITLKGHS